MSRDSGRQVFPTPMELQIMRLLQKSNGMYGQEIVRAGAIKAGTTYGILQRLERKGFVRHQEASGIYPGMRRPVYRTTRAGNYVLRVAAMLVSP